MTADESTATAGDEGATTRDATDGPQPNRAPPRSVTAVVLTHMRPRLAGEVTRSLLEVEGFAPDRVVVVVNGVGGLDDPELEARVRMVRLPVNLGPAGGFRAGLLEAFSDPDTEWAYLCEDDVSLFALPAPRLGALVERVEGLGSGDPEGTTGRSGRRLREALRRPRNPHGQRRPRGRRAERPHPGRRRLLGRDPRFESGGRRGGAPRCRMVLRPRGLRLLLQGARSRVRRAGR